MNKYKLGDIASIQAGPFGTQLHQNEYVSLGVPILNSKNIGNGKIISESLDYVPQSVLDRLPQYILEEGDILFGRAGTIERHTYVNANYSGSFQGTNCIRIRCHNKEVSLYISYYLWLDQLKQSIENKASGSIQSYITTDLLKDITIYIPENYKQIANILSIIDKKIENNKKINDNLQHQLKLIYDYWFTQFDFPDKNGKPYHSSGGAMVWNDELQREIPVGWECRTLADLLIKNNEIFDYSGIKPTIDLSVMPSASISLSKLNSSDQFSTNLFVMHEGDILFGSIRPYLKKAGIAPCNGVVTGTVHSYHVKNDYEYNFALFTLCQDNFFNYALTVSTGTKMPVVSSDSILSYKIPYSRNIVEQFNQVNICKIICRNIQESNNLSALRDWLLPMLMNGQVSIINEQAMESKFELSNFEKWIVSQGYAARGNVNIEILRNVYEAMDDDDK